jgi:hypothetical protein
VFGGSWVFDPRTPLNERQVRRALNLPDEAKGEESELAKKIIALARQGDSAALLRGRMLREIAYGRNGWAAGSQRPHLPNESGGHPFSEGGSSSAQATKAIRSARRAMNDRTCPPAVSNQRSKKPFSAFHCFSISGRFGSSSETCGSRG